MNGFSGNVSCALRGQESHHRSYFFRLAQTPCRNNFQHSVTLLVVQFFGHIGVNKTGRYTVSGNATVRHFFCQAAGEALNPGLGSAIIALPRVAHTGNYGTDIDNPAPARSEEHTSELQSRPHLVCRLLLEKKKKK